MDLLVDSREVIRNDVGFIPIIIFLHYSVCYFINLSNNFVQHLECMSCQMCISSILIPLQAMHSGGCYIFAMSRCPDVSPVVPCQHGLLHRVGESTVHMQQWRHHMTMHSLKHSSYGMYLMAGIVVS